MFEWIENLPSTEFLIFYGVVIAVTLGTYWWLLRHGETTLSLGLPEVPSEPDPYEIAYLKGDENLVTIVLIVNLTLRDYVRVVEETKGIFGTKQTIAQAPNHPDQRHLSALERAVFDELGTGITVKELFAKRLSELVNRHCARLYESRFETAQLIKAPGHRAREARIALVAGSVIVGLGGFRLVHAFLGGRANVGFLIGLVVVALLLLAIIREKRLTAHGRAYLGQLMQTFFGGLKSQTSRAPQDMRLPLLVAIFGMLALRGTPLSYYFDMFSKGGSGGGWGGGNGGGNGGG